MIASGCSILRSWTTGRSTDAKEAISSAAEGSARDETRTQDAVSLCEGPARRASASGRLGWTPHAVGVVQRNLAVGGLFGGGFPILHSTEVNDPLEVAQTNLRAKRRILEGP